MSRTENDLREFYARCAEDASAGAGVLTWLDDHSSSAAHEPRRGRRRGFQTVAAALAVLVVALICVGGADALFSQQHSPQPGVSPKVRQPSAQGLQGAFVDPRHPRTLELVIMVGVQPKKIGGVCTARGVPTVTSQTSQDVTVRVHAPAPASRSQARRSSSLEVCAETSVPLTRVRLAHPLGHRDLIDQLSGRQVPVYDVVSIPHAATIPAGYRPERVQLVVASIGRTGVVSPVHGCCGADPWPFEGIRPYVTRSYRNGDDTIDINVGRPRPGLDPARFSAGHARTTVDGYPAYVDILRTKPERAVCVNWQTSAERVINVCSQNDPLDSSPPHRAPLSVAQVERIARHLK